MKTFTVDEVLNSMREAVAERGKNFRYHDHYQKQSCQYVELTDEGAEPACIVGNVLHRLGVPIDILMLIDKQGPCLTSVNAFSSAFKGVLYDNGFDMTSQAYYALSAAQQQQDINNSWGEALRVAEYASQPV